MLGKIFDVKAMATGVAGIANSAAEALGELAEGDIGGAVSAVGRGYENVGNVVEGALDYHPILGGVGDLYQAGGRLLQGDLEGAIREGAQGVFETSGWDDIARLVGGPDAARNLVQTTLDGVFKNPEGIKRSMEFIGRTNKPLTTKIADAHCPPRPSECQAQVRESSERLEKDIQECQKGPDFEFHAYCKLPHAFAHFGMFPEHGGWEQEKPGCEPRPPQACLKIEIDFKDRLCKFINQPIAGNPGGLVPGGPRYGINPPAGSPPPSGVKPGVVGESVVESGKPESALDRLPKPATFEDIVAAFMIDEVVNQQDKIKEKMDQLRAIDAKLKTAEAKKTDDAKSTDKAGDAKATSGDKAGSGDDRKISDFLSKTAGFVEMAGTIAGVAGTVIPIIAPMIATLVPVGTIIAAKLMAATTALKTFSMIAPLLAQGMKMLAESGLADKAWGAIKDKIGGDEEAGSVEGQSTTGANETVGSEQAKEGVSGTSEGTPADKETLERSRTILFEEMKASMNKLQQMQTALSDVLKAMHDTAMGSIRNIK